MGYKAILAKAFVFTFAFAWCERTIRWQGLFAMKKLFATFMCTVPKFTALVPYLFAHHLVPQISLIPMRAVHLITEGATVSSLNCTVPKSYMYTYLAPYILTCFLIFVGPISFLCGHWLPLFWTSCDPPIGFQKQDGSLACMLTCLHVLNLRVMSGATPAFFTNRGVHCISMYTAGLPHASSGGQAMVYANFW